MKKVLQYLFGVVANTSDEGELRLAATDALAEYFNTEHCGIYFFDDLSAASLEYQGIPEVCLGSNPVFGYVSERHSPVHEELVLSPGDWKHFCKRSDHEHVMTGPIVVDGSLVGTVNLTRSSGSQAFNANDLADLSALCIHLSAKLATLRTRSQKKVHSPFKSRLTPRETQIAQLVAQGFTNAEIGAKLWIQENSVKQALKRMFRKLEVSSRAEMVAKLQDILVL